MKPLQILGLLLFGLFCGTRANAQQGLLGSVYFGYSNYVGDLTEPTFTFIEPRLAFGVGVTKTIDARQQLMGSLVIGHLAGSDENYDRNRDRNASFKSSLIELTVQYRYHFVAAPPQPQEEADEAKPVLSPFVFGGVGFGYVNPETKLNGTNFEESDLSKGHFTIPLGAGLTLFLPSGNSLSLEWGIRLPFSDDLDGLSATANPDDRDYYFSGGLRYGFSLGGKRAEE